MNTVVSRPWHYATTCDLDEFRELVEVPTDPASCPNAADIVNGVPIYDARTLLSNDRPVIMAELAGVLADGPGALGVRGAVDVAAVDAATAQFEQMIDEQHRRGMQVGDHYAKPGANDRIWNSLGKLAVAAPETFVDYYSSPALDIVIRSWLGPAYQYSSQVNRINPGGEAQQPHRDYHLGFLTDEVAEQFPPQAHALSPALTLQGAVAHCDTPVESGPTKLLPHSQKYPAGFVAWRRPDFKQYFEDHHVQVPLRTGDAAFFSPALFHAGGANRSTDIFRMANLVQVSSCMGRAMESIDRDTMCRVVFPVLRARADAGWDPVRLELAITATAESYAFPTNLDNDPPLDGLAPPAQADILRRAVHQRWTDAQLGAELDALERRRSGTV